VDADHSIFTQKAAFTVNEFCVRFGICRSLFYAEVRAGRLKTRKAGRRTLVLRRDADAWAEALPAGGARV